MTAAIALTALLAGCGGEQGGSTETMTETTVPAVDDRDLFRDEADGVGAVVADCFVVQADGTTHFRTTVEVRNRSDVARRVVVKVSSTGGVESEGAAVEVPAGASDAWAVTAREETAAPVGDIDCVEAVAGITVVAEPVGD